MKLFSKKRTRKQRVFLLHKRYLAIPAALLTICALCLVTTLPTYVSASTTQRQLPIYCVQRDYKVCALSFDAAWGNAILRQGLSPLVCATGVPCRFPLVSPLGQNKHFFDLMI